MKRIGSAFLALTLVFIIFGPAPANAGGGNGWAIGGVLLGVLIIGSIIHHDHVIVGPVYPAYPPPVYYIPPATLPPVYYQPPVIYQPQPVWIPDHYELRWQTVCEVMYQHQHCYRIQMTVFIPGHWEY